MKMPGEPDLTPIHYALIGAVGEDYAGAVQFVRPDRLDASVLVHRLKHRLGFIEGVVGQHLGRPGDHELD